MQPDFHIIIHKLTEDISSSSSSASSRLAHLTSYLSSHPSTVLCDSIDAVRHVITRDTTLRLLESIPEPLFAIPSYTLLPSPATGSNLSYPVICKPLEACGTPLSHQLAVIAREQDLHLLRCILLDLIFCYLHGCLQIPVHCSAVY